jgi:hypothetical protein
MAPAISAGSAGWRGAEDVSQPAPLTLACHIRTCGLIMAQIRLLSCDVGCPLGTVVDRE